MSVLLGEPAAVMKPYTVIMLTFFMHWGATSEPDSENEGMTSVTVVAQDPQRAVYRATRTYLEYCRTNELDLTSVLPIACIAGHTEVGACDEMEMDDMFVNLGLTKQDGGSFFDTELGQITAAVKDEDEAAPVPTKSKDKKPK